MAEVSSSHRIESLFELSWNYAQDGKIAVDVAIGLLVDVNPAMEALTGYSRAELINMHVTMLHPKPERELVKAEFSKASPCIEPHFDLHIQRKDGRCIPVAIWSSEKLRLADRSVVIGEFRDITDLVQKEQRLSVQNWALGAYAIAALALGQAHNSESLLLKSICEAITRQSIYVLAWIGIAEDGPGKKIQIAAEAGKAIGYLDGMNLSWSEDEAWGKSPTGICIRTNTTQITDDTQRSPTYTPWRKRSKQFGILSAVSISFRIGDISQGALVIYAAHPGEFEPLAVEVLQHLAEEVGRGVYALKQKQIMLKERERMVETEMRLSEALSAMVAPIVLAMEMRDPYTAGHQSRVAEIAVAIGKEMGWPERRLEGLRVAAQVHDIGKISIPAEILTKPGPLNSEERALINTHSGTGYTILKDIPFDWPIAEIVHQHHEKPNGSGYPRGLKADEILPEAKILAVADVVEAMASYRPYRPAIPLDIVLKEIESEAGTLLDPEVVQVCLSLFRDKHFVLPSWQQH